MPLCHGPGVGRTLARGGRAGHCDGIRGARPRSGGGGTWRLRWWCGQVFWRSWDFWSSRGASPAGHESLRAHMAPEGLRREDDTDGNGWGMCANEVHAMMTSSPQTAQCG